MRETIRFAVQEALSREAKWLELAAHLPDEDDTIAARALLDLARDDEPETAPNTAPPDGPTNTGHRLMAALVTAEEDLREVRLALEEAFPRNIEADQ